MGKEDCSITIFPNKTVVAKSHINKITLHIRHTIHKITLRTEQNRFRSFAFKIPEPPISLSLLLLWRSKVEAAISTTRTKVPQSTFTTTAMASLIQRRQREPCGWWSVLPWCLALYAPHPPTLLFLSPRLSFPSTLLTPTTTILLLRFAFSPPHSVVYFLFSFILSTACFVFFISLFFCFLFRFIVSRASSLFFVFFSFSCDSFFVSFPRCSRVWLNFNIFV